MAKARPVTCATSSRTRWLRRLIAGGLAVGLAAGAAAATAAAQEPRGTPVRPPVRCGTAACTAAVQALRAAQFPPANPVLPPRSRWVTRAQAVAAARHDAQTAEGGPLSAAVARVLPARAAEMTIRQFDVGQHFGADAGIAPGRLVWVVTVHGHMAEDAPPGRSPYIADVYTDVYDVATGTLMDRGIGLAAVR